MNIFETMIVTKALAQEGTILGEFGTLFDFNQISQLFRGEGDAMSLDAIVLFGVDLLLLVAGLAAFIFLLISGVQYVTAGGDSDKATKARTGILNAIIGIVIILIAYALVLGVSNFLVEEARQLDF